MCKHKISGWFSSMEEADYTDGICMSRQNTPPYLGLYDNPK